MSITKDILWPHSEDFDINPWMSTDFSAHRMKFSLGQRQKMWQCEAYTPTPSHHVKESILSCTSLLLTIIFIITSWVGCQNLPCACPQLCSGFCYLAYKETKEGSPIHCKGNSTRAFLFSACCCIPFFCLQALSAITTCLSLVKVMTCLSLPAFLWREWLRHLAGNIGR
jgi:hypothetical protein